LHPNSRPQGLPGDAAQPPPPRPPADATLGALDDLVAAAEQMAQVTTLIREHADVIRTCRARGVPYRQIVELEGQPLIAAVFTDAIPRFEAAGTRFRQAKAAALRQEGLTMEEIGALFGLTRQRISGLLQEATELLEPDVT
jgi:hypothetical protein